MRAETKENNPELKNPKLPGFFILLTYLSAVIAVRLIIADVLPTIKDSKNYIDEVKWFYELKAYLAMLFQLLLIFAVIYLYIKPKISWFFLVISSIGNFIFLLPNINSFSIYKSSGAEQFVNAHLIINVALTIFFGISSLSLFALNPGSKIKWSTKIIYYFISGCSLIYIFTHQPEVKIPF